ncbi:MAG: hypothetical protein UR25_C0005G0067 [Candidatus Nomurabacteria bacterium GW2011_GWE1_32_28]|uniref:Glucose/sorbosone dehydrogenase n=1 Tax=Candidatus Nomurabacteria bacterium GW2011_GWF1_31_48 TaxID=1618767 RepID=A0A0G0AT03_9BACT|nr:MAG: hypothetical protein UR10_C0006G0024 [Candidatus Nomurabacteria bacterium GW2011_GWF2_30_133]KKP28245.1 MAG: hypothetical protein UR18_C0007G0013 [Candidatus Nomurabacteria bacterium GW2011_GWE2_31_40]KKP29840.1 MAG: hypothetical protein UR19_C0007G0014 [Candidatus Nomurabacteria bacterium GW2011_GWF1_31_48]KKP34581.1 MAG: hypothetical protein UR25_C0005G0067 [Candidatus Nomurabacteria bacterium GW2011_GWE1_32_28]HAS80435.1 hypothetical protein [Candidatus Nomurabacteria bacterium]
MTWALKRQLFYVSVLVIFLGVLGFLIVFPFMKEIPSCTDNKQNGDEKGIDCGGSCIKACIFEVDKVSVLWARTFKVVSGRYNAVAYLENHNKDAAIYKIKYKFRFSDENNIYIGKREGETFIPASGNFAIFEAGIGVGNSIPVYTSFEFTETPVWNNVSEDKLDQLKVFVSDIKLENQNSSPRLSATIKNDSLFNIPEVSIVALLYNEKGNVVSSSRTYLDMLSGEESRDISFTWPEPIQGNIISKEIIPMYNIFLVKLK